MLELRSFLLGVIERYRGTVVFVGALCCLIFCQTKPHSLPANADRRGLGQTVSLLLSLSTVALLVLKQKTGEKVVGLTWFQAQC